MTSAAETSKDAARPSTPPYTAYPSFKTAISVFKTVIVPERVDRSVWGNKFSGQVVTQMIAAFKFLGLISNEGIPTQRLRTLVGAFGTEAWSLELRSVLEHAYAPILTNDLDKVSPTQFNERFREAFKAEGETLRKCMTFFLQAAREAGITLSPFLLSGTKPRAGGTKRKPRTKAPRADKPEEEDLVENNTPASMTDRLLDKFPEFDPSWPKEIQEKWFAGFAELMNRTKS